MANNGGFGAFVQGLASGLAMGQRFGGVLQKPQQSGQAPALFGSEQTAAASPVQLPAMPQGVALPEQNGTGATMPSFAPAQLAAQFGTGGGPLQAGLARMPAKPQVDPAQMTFDQGA